MPVTGIPVLDVALQVVGGLYFILSALGNAPILSETKAGAVMRQLSLSLRK